MSRQKKDTAKVTEKPPVTAPEVTSPSPEESKGPGESAEVVLIKSRIVKLLDGHRKVVISKTAEEVSSLRRKLRDMGATDIP